MSCHEWGIKSLTSLTQILNFWRMEKLRSFLELQFFGVCSYLGDKLAMPSSKIRLFFIYATFVTAGSPVIIYLVLAFLIKMKDYIKGRRTAVWDV